MNRFAISAVGAVPLLNLRGAEIDSIESKDTVIKSKKGGRNP